MIEPDVADACTSLVDAHAAAMPDRAHIDETIWVSARAQAPDGTPVSYLWSLEQPELGYFLDAGAADTTFHCAGYAQSLRLNVTMFAGSCAVGASTTVSCLGVPKP